MKKNAFSSASKFTKTVIIIEFFLVSYMLYALTSSIYKNYQIDEHIKKLEAENQEYQQENEQKRPDFEYYASEFYIKKIAKQDLGLVEPGEEVIVLPPVEENSLVMSDKEIKQREQNNYSNPQRWWYFFFNRDKLS